MFWSELQGIQMYYTKNGPPNKSEKECSIITFYGAEERNNLLIS